MIHKIFFCHLETVLFASSSPAASALPPRRPLAGRAASPKQIQQKLWGQTSRRRRLASRRRDRLTSLCPCS